MGQKVHPTGVRVGIIKDWNSKWYADSKNFADYLVEDQKIRKYVKQKLYVSGISKIEIERTAKFVKINVYTAKPGIVIGKGGQLSEQLKKDLEKMKEIYNYVDGKIREYKNKGNGTVQQLSPADELKKFKELLDAGIITQEEFDAKKKELLGL